ncbi:MAG: prepilin-type N-terminal cleavage/methylation domain-containing protein [Planctomycetota bacterium]
MNRRRRHHSRGMTLLELVISLSITVIVLAGITSAVMLAGDAVQANIVAANETLDANFGLNELNEDLTLATSIDDIGSHSIALTVPDRTGDNADETVVYLWVDDGGNITRTLNNEPASVIATGVQSFDVNQIVRTTKIEADKSASSPPDPLSWGYFDTQPAGICPSLVLESTITSYQENSAQFIDIAMPANIAEGDLLIATVVKASHEDDSAPTPISPPDGSGWTLIDLGSEEHGDLDEEYIALGVWWKLADADEAAVQTFRWTTANRSAVAWVSRITGHDEVQPIRSYTVSSGMSINPPSPGIVTTVDNAMVLRVGGFDDADIIDGDPGLSGSTALLMSSTAGNQVSGGAGYSMHETPGSVLATTFSLTAEQQYRAVTLEIAPCGAPAAIGDGPTFLDFTLQKEPTKTQRIDMTTPTANEGDLLIAAVATDGSESITAGTGWTRIDMQDDGSKVTLGVWWKLATASEPSTHRFSWGSNEEATGAIMRFTGHDSITPVDVSAFATGKSASPSAPNAEPTVDGALILRVGGFDDDDITVGDAGVSGNTTILMDEAGSGDKPASLGAAYVVQSSKASTGTADFTLTGNEEYVTITVAIAPAP